MTSPSLKQLCRFYENVVETRVSESVVNECVCEVRRKAWDLGCHCYNCQGFIQYHATWQKDNQMNTYRSKRLIENVLKSDS
jgi:hypothetical protein